MKTIVNKSQFVILLMTLACTLSTIAQPPGRMRERIKEKKEQVKSQKIAFITQELNLSPDEAAKFWPIYNAYDEKQAEIRKQKVNAFMDRNDSDALDRLTEKEAQNALSQMENTEDELYKLRKKFLADIKNVLPSVKIIKLKRAEEAFNRKLIERLRERRGKK